MDPEGFTNDNTSIFDDKVSWDNFCVRLFLELYTVIGVLSIACNVLLIFAMVKYKRLRETNNIIFAHFCGLQAFFFVSSHTSMRLFLHFSKIPRAVYCVLDEMTYGIQFAMFLTLVLLITGWYIKTYKIPNYRKFTKVYPFVIVIIYLTLISSWAVSAHLCIINEWFIFSTLFILLAVGLFLTVFLIVINIIHAVKKRRAVSTEHNTFNLGLIVSNIFVLSWVPSLLILLLLVPSIHYYLLDIFLVTIGFSSPIFVLFYLYFNEMNFNVFLKKIVQCRCNDYRNESLEDEAVIVYNTSVQ